MKALGLALVTVFLALGAAHAQDEAQPLKSALARCFNFSSGIVPSVSDPKTIPPGLIDGRDVNIVAVPGTSRHAFSYRGTGTHVISCGIAIYGPVSDTLQNEISRIIDNDLRWKPYSPSPYKHPGAPAAEKYWGASRASSMNGVVLRK